MSTPVRSLFEVEGWNPRTKIIPSASANESKRPDTSMISPRLGYRKLVMQVYSTPQSVHFERFMFTYYLICHAQNPNTASGNCQQLFSFTKNTEKTENKSFMRDFTPKFKPPFLPKQKTHCPPFSAYQSGVCRSPPVPTQVWKPGRRARTSQKRFQLAAA